MKRSILTIATISLIMIFYSFSEAQQIWWLKEYKDFVKYVSAAPNKTVNTSYKTGPNSEKVVHLEVSVDKGKQVLLTVRPPKESVVAFDEKTGKTVPASENPRFLIKDVNFDGILDMYKMEPGIPISNIPITKDGFIIFTGKERDKTAYIQWIVGIGFCVNHFMHGIDSVFPK